jgi:hypothetical protein
MSDMAIFRQLPSRSEAVETDVTHVTDRNSYPAQHLF